MSSVQPPSQTFRDLALALTEEERRALLKRISASLNLRPPTVDRPLISVAADGERSATITREINSMGFWMRVRYLLRRLFSARTQEQTYLELRLAGLRRRARSVLPALGALERHSVRAVLAERLYELYRAAYPIIPLFHDMWKNGKEYLPEAVEHLLSNSVPKARSDLYDLATLDDLQTAFIEREQKGDVRRLVMDRLDEYLNGIPDELFRHLENGLLPFYYLRPLALLNYGELLSVFGFDPGIAPPQTAPPFKDAPASAALPGMERLYVGLHSAAKLDAGFTVHAELLERYLEIKDQERDTGAADGLDTAPPERDRRSHLHELRERITAFHSACVAFSRDVPLADMIRYYRRDPWLRIRPYVPRLELREFYRSFLMIRFLGNLDERFPQIRRGVVDRLAVELFGTTPRPMNYYRPSVQMAPGKGGLPTFRHMRSLAGAFNFLRYLYRGRMQNMLRILSRILPARQRDSNVDLIAHVAGVEAITADIVRFDESFSPESDEGKALYRMRYAVEKDATMHRSYRNLVAQRDREAVALVERAVEHTTGLGAALETIGRTLTDQLRERYSAADPRANPVDGLDQLLQEHGTKIDQFTRLIRQVRAMEEGL